MLKHSLVSFAVLVTLITCGFAQQSLPSAAGTANASPSADSPSSPISSSLNEALDLYRHGKLDDAAAKYQTIIQQDSKAGDAYAGLARTYLKQEKTQGAFEAAQKGVSAAPDSMAAHTALGEVLFRQAKMGESEQEFVNVVNSGHADPRAYLGLARLYDAYSLFAKARTMINRAHDRDPNDPEIQRRWMGTLPRGERIKLLEEYLAKPTNDDAEQHESLQRYLEYLKARAQQPTKSCKLVSKVKATETALEPMLIDPRHIQGYGLKVKVNGQSSRLLLDTGASGLLINRKMAERAGVERLSATKITGVGDKEGPGGYVAFADSIKIGDLEFQNCPVEVSEKRSVMDDDGLIGADVFSGFLVTIDFPNQKLRLSELPKRPNETEKEVSLQTTEEDDPATEPEEHADDKAAAEKKPSPPPGPQDRYVAPEMQSYTKIFRFGHELLIPTRVSGAPPKLFLIDTGGFANMISPDAAREVTKVHSDSRMQIRGLSGTVKNVYSADKAVIQFSHFSQENQDLVAFDLSKISKHTGTEVSGILGFAMLRMLTMKIDYRDGLVDFDYDAKRFGGR
ncbi:MAG TPA: aspartyl protease family protein [Terriglobales bacterium]